MNYTFNWSVKNVNVSVNPIGGLNDVVVSCDWLIEGSLLSRTPGVIINNGVRLDGYVKAVNENLTGTITFENPNTNNFVELKNLNQSIILEWVWDLIDKTDKENELKSLLDEKKNNQTKVVNIR